MLELNRIINMSFTWFNVNPSYKNQTIAYSVDDGKNFQNLVFPSGVWSYTDFNEYIKRMTGNEEISLTFDATTFRVTIELQAKIRLNLTKSDFTNDLIQIR